MDKALLQFSIGPVQSFISQARKLQDLYTGSKLLSELSEQAIEIAENNGATIIFPGENIKSKPNVFLAELDVEGLSEEHIKGIGQNIETEVKNIYIHMLCEPLYDDDLSPKFDEQIANHLSINWLIYPYDSEKQTYDLAFNEIQKLFQEIKKTRTFTQYKQQGRICSMCGERVALFYNGNRLPRHLKQATKVDKNDAYKFNEGEALCGICYSKRLYFNRGGFSSIAEICTMDKMDGFNEQNFRNYKQRFGNKYNAELLYEENLDKEFLKKNGLSHLVAQIEELKQLRKDFLNGQKLKKYYAIIMSDGDTMGKWIGGEYLTNESQLKEFQNFMSDSLGSYGSNLSNNIDNNRYGTVVYNGGDDILAFLNLEYLFTVLEDIRNFPDITNGGAYQTNQTFTASAGIVIAHYKTPLNTTLRKAREMESVAKETGQRNAFALSVLKHSGETLSTVYKWRYDNADPISLMKELYEEINTNRHYSTTFIHMLREEFQKLINTAGQMGTLNIEMVKAELKRLLGRACMMEKQDGESGQDYRTRKTGSINNFTNKLYSLFRTDRNLENLLSLLEVIDFMTRKVK